MIAAAFEPRIVGGRDAKPGEVPYQVSCQQISTNHVTPSVSS